MHHRSRAFTLVEMLVVISIITVLASLILPAVQNARESARQLQCNNRMRQIGLGFLQFTTAKGRLPARGRWLTTDNGTGAYVSASNTSFAYPAHSWVVDVLPFMEQQEIHNRWNFKCTYGNAANSRNAMLSGTFLKVLVCPNDDSIEAGQGNLSYVVNGGFFRAYQAIVPSNIDYNEDGDVNVTDAADCRNGGVAWPNYSRSLASITDGTSTTVLLTESLRVGYDESVTPASTWANPNRCHFLSPRPSDADLTPEGDTAAYDAANNINSPFPLGEGTYAHTPTGQALINPTSYHPGGVNVFFCDGHIQFISQRIDGRVWAKVLTPRGARMVTPRLRQLVPDEDQF